MRAVRGVRHRMNADFSYAFEHYHQVVVFRLIVARLHLFQWAIAKHRRTFLRLVQKPCTSKAIMAIAPTMINIRRKSASLYSLLF